MCHCVSALGHTQPSATCQRNEWNFESKKDSILVGRSFGCLFLRVILCFPSVVSIQQQNILCRTLSVELVACTSFKSSFTRTVYCDHWLREPEEKNINTKADREQFVCVLGIVWQIRNLASELWVWKNFKWMNNEMWWTRVQLWEDSVLMYCAVFGIFVSVTHNKAWVDTLLIIACDVQNSLINVVVVNGMRIAFEFNNICQEETLHRAFEQWRFNTNHMIKVQISMLAHDSVQQSSKHSHDTSEHLTSSTQLSIFFW